MDVPDFEPHDITRLLYAVKNMPKPQVVEMACSKCRNKCTTWGIVDGKVVCACCLSKQQQRPGPSEYKRDDD